MTTTHSHQSHHRYARAIAASKRARWNIDTDVIRARTFERGEKFLPDVLSLAHELTFLQDDERIFLSQVQGRTYFIAQTARALSAPQKTAIRATILRAYRHQYILSGVSSTRFVEILRGLIGDEQLQRVERALNGLQP